MNHAIEGEGHVDPAEGLAALRAIAQRQAEQRAELAAVREFDAGFDPRGEPT